MSSWTTNFPRNVGQARYVNEQAAGGPTSGNIYLTDRQSRVGVSAATVDDSVALGQSALAQASETTVIGGLARGTPVGATVVGYDAIIDAGANNSTSVGRRTFVSADFSVAVGQIASCNTPGTGSTCVGRQAVSNAANCTCVGMNTTANNQNSTVIGEGATSSHDGAVVIGKDAVSVAGSSLSIKSVNAPVVAAAGASDVYLLVAINGVQYKLLLHT